MMGSYDYDSVTMDIIGRMSIVCNSNDNNIYKRIWYGTNGRKVVSIRQLTRDETPKYWNYQVPRTQTADQQLIWLLKLLEQQRNIHELNTNVKTMHTVITRPMGFALRKQLYIIKGDSHNKDSDIIIDYNFRDFFRIARPSNRYNRIIDCLPMTFCGNRSLLMQYITCMSIVLEQEYRNTDKDLPPWRTKENILRSYNLAK